MSSAFMPSTRRVAIFSTPWAAFSVSRLSSLPSAAASSDVSIRSIWVDVILVSPFPGAFFGGPCHSGGCHDNSACGYRICLHTSSARFFDGCAGSHRTLYDRVVSEFRSTSSNRPPLTVTPLEEGQGCIAEPKANWVGIYWISATLLYTASVRHQIPLHCIPYLPNKLNHSC